MHDIIPVLNNSVEKKIIFFTQLLILTTNNVLTREKQFFTIP